MKDESSARRQWLEEMRDRYAFLEKTFPTVMERYEKKREKLMLKLMLKKE